MVTTKSEQLRDRLVLFRSHGITKRPDQLELPDVGGWHQEQHALGFNYRLTDIQAALGRSQLRKLGRFVERRNEIAARYREQLADVEQLILPPAAPPGAVHGYHLFVVRHRDGAPGRRHVCTTGCGSVKSSRRCTTCRCTCTRGIGRRTARDPGSHRSRSGSTRAASRCRVSRRSQTRSRTESWMRCVRSWRREVPLGIRDRCTPRRRREPLLRDRGGRVEPRSRSREGAAAHRSCGECGGGRREVPDLFRKSRLLAQDALVRLSRAGERRPVAVGAPVRDRAAAGVARRARRAMPRASGSNSSRRRSTPTRSPSSTHSTFPR